MEDQETGEKLYRCTVCDVHLMCMRTDKIMKKVQIFPYFQKRTIPRREQAVCFCFTQTKKVDSQVLQLDAES